MLSHAVHLQHLAPASPPKTPGAVRGLSATPCGHSTSCLEQSQPAPSEPAWVPEHDVGPQGSAADGSIAASSSSVCTLRPRHCFPQLMQPPDLASTGCHHLVRISLGLLSPAGHRAGCWRGIRMLDGDWDAGQGPECRCQRAALAPAPCPTSLRPHQRWGRRGRCCSPPEQLHHPKPGHPKKTC